MTERAGLRRVDDVFSRWAHEGRAERMEESHRSTAMPALDALPLPPGARFLDLGAGNAWAAREAARRGASVAIAVDVSLPMLRRARNVRPARHALTPVRAAFETLPFADRAFDAAWSMEALYYAGDLEAAIAELARVLRPGAAAHIVVDRYAENAASHGWDAMLGVPMHLLSESEWAAAFGRQGFGAVQTRRLRAAEGDDWHATEGSLLVEARRG